MGLDAAATENAAAVKALLAHLRNQGLPTDRVGWRRPGCSLKGTFARSQGIGISGLWPAFWGVKQTSNVFAKKGR